MKYLLDNTIKYKIDTVTEVEKLHEKMKSLPNCTLVEFSYKTKYIKEKGEVIGEYQLVSVKLNFNDEKEPENCFIDVAFSNSTEGEDMEVEF